MERMSEYTGPLLVQTTGGKMKDSQPLQISRPVPIWSQVTSFMQLGMLWL